MKIEKLKVVIFLENLTTTDRQKPVLHYLIEENEIKDMCLKLFLKKMDASFSSLEEFFINKGLEKSWNAKFEQYKDSTVKKYNATNPYEFFLAYCIKNINETMDFINRGGCGEGAITFDCKEMTREEYENPTGEILSPYAYEFLEENEKPKSSKYSFYHPITKKLIELK